MRAQSPSVVRHSMAPSQGGDGEGVYPKLSAENRGNGTSSFSSSSAGVSNFSSWSGFRGQLVSAGALWLVGFKEACQIHRAITFCKRSRPVLIKTGQCFLLNGFFFLGSLLVLRRVVVPVLRWFLGPELPLPAHRGHVTNENLISAGVLQTVVVGLCYVFWLYPLYIISFVVNIIWYNDIAKHAFQVMDQNAPIQNRNSATAKGTAKDHSANQTVKGHSANQTAKGRSANQTAKGPSANQTAKGRSANQNSSGLQSAVLQIGEQIYSVLMVSVFFVEVFAVSYIPYFGPLLNFVLLSWLYAYYCFDYKWGFERWSLERRLLFFETNWAFFAGFGSPCVLATYFLSPFVSAGVMNVLFPLFVLVATASNPEKAVLKCSSSQNSTGTMRRLPIFYLANNVTVPLLELLQPTVSTMPSSIQSRKKGY